MSSIDIRDFGLPTAGPGFIAQYFVLPRWVSDLDQIDFEGIPSAVEVVDELNTTRSYDPFWADGPTDSFAALYVGNLNVSTAGVYTIYLTSDDGAALYLDGQRVINNDGLHPSKLIPVTLDLTAGSHDIELRYFEAGGAQTLKLEWSGPDTGGETRVMGVDVVDYTAQDVAGEGDEIVSRPGLEVEFFRVSEDISNLNQIDFYATPDATDVVDRVQYDSEDRTWWENGSEDHFALKISGQLNISEAGTYRFHLVSDDGSALYIDGERVIDNDGLHAKQILKVSSDLDAGLHDIEIRYFEHTGDQLLKLKWSGPDTGGEVAYVDGGSLSHLVPITDDGVDGNEGDEGDEGNENNEGDEGDEVVDGDEGDEGDENNEGNEGDEGNENDEGDEGDEVVDGDEGDEHNDGHDDSSTGHDGADMPDTIPEPTTASEIEAFVVAVMAEPNAHAHGDDMSKMMEHAQLLELVPRSEATHVAVSDGDWFDTSTWHQGRIPDADAKVFIPKNIAVNYNGESDASLFTVRVDGALSFSTDTDSKMVVDTLVVDASGRLEVGTADNPIDANVNVDIVIANNGDIDVNWDPTLLSRGVISHGQVEIHGAEKDSFLKVSDAPMSGETSLRLAEIPDGWQVGDKLVVTGTHNTGWGNESQDEEVTITAINGNQVSFDRALEYDHDTPRDDLFAYVANMSRNITFSSEDGDATEIHHRGHTMFMHNDDVDVRFAGFEDLGRTDKSIDAFDVGSLSSVEADSNIKSRYPFHFHKTGTEDQQNPAMAVGNVVDGSPGWGYAHHSSNANFTDNVSFDAFGAGFAAESGDETGVWIGNMAIKSEGTGFGAWEAKEADNVERQDTGHTGDGFFFAGRLVEAAENVAVNTTNGYVWMHRNTGADPLSENLDHPEIAYGSDTLRVNLTPIQGFRDNEAFGTHTGLMVIKATAEQDQHDMRSVFDGFLNWETNNGVDISYTAHYTLLDFDLIGAAEGTSAQTTTGVEFGTNTYDMVMNGLKIEGFEQGVNLDQVFHYSMQDEDIGHVIIDLETINVGTNIEGFDNRKHQLLTSSDLSDGPIEFIHNGDTSLAVGETFDLDGIKTDSIGTIDRANGHEPLDLDFYKQIIHLIAGDGYYKTTDGRNVVIVEDFLTDRATGEVTKISHVVTLEMTDAEIANNWMINNTTSGAKYNGIIDLSGAPATARNDTASTQSDHDVLIDVLANDFDPEGAFLKVDGVMDAQHGDVFLQDDGRLLYQPNVGFAGTDTFIYWAADDAGNYSQASVTVEVWDY